MAEEPQENDSTTLPDDASTQEASSAIAPVQYDPQYIAQLENYYRETQPYLQKIEPIYKDLVEPALADDEERKFLLSARQHYLKTKESNEPQLSPELELLEKRLEAKFKPAVDLSTSLIDQQNKDRATAEKQAYDANYAYAQKLTHSKVFQEDNGARLQRLIKYAGANGLTVEQAHKELYQEAQVAPVDSTPADAGRAGVPPKPKREKGENVDVYDMVLKSVQAANRSRAS